MDPLPRVRMAERSSMGPPMKLGSFVEGRGGGTVVRSQSDLFAEGDLVVGELGWRDYATLPAEALTGIDAAIGGVDRHLGILGASGLTGFFLTERAHARPGEVALVAPAAGSVGIVAVQLLVAQGVRVVGIVGGEEQGDFVRSLGAEAFVDHRSRTFEDDLSEALPDGWDIFLDGVGGRGHDHALRRMNIRARLVLFGFISSYGSDGPPAYGSVPALLLKRATAEGFLLADYLDRHHEARLALSQKISAGTLKEFVSVTEGLDDAPAAFAALFEDAAPGKQLVRVGENQS